MNEKYRERFSTYVRAFFPRQTRHDERARITRAIDETVGRAPRRASPEPRRTLADSFFFSLVALVFFCSSSSSSRRLSLPAFWSLICECAARAFMCVLSCNRSGHYGEYTLSMRARALLIRRERFCACRSRFLGFSRK